MGLKGKSIAVLFLLLAGLVQPAGSAEVKPLEVFSEKIFILEIEHFASEHALASVSVRKTVDRLNRELNIMSQERIQESLKLLAAAREDLAEALRTSAALSNYIAANSKRLQAAGHGRFLPLADLDSEIEKPYYQSLDSFLATAGGFVRFCRDNLDAIATGQADAGRQYDKLYAAYLQEMDSFNSRSINRSRQLTDLADDYPALWELLPR